MNLRLKYCLWVLPWLYWASSASTLNREVKLETLVAESDAIVRGEVVASKSYKKRLKGHDKGE